MFRELIAGVLSKHEEVAGHRPLENVGLRYVNLIPADQEAWTRILAVRSPFAGDLGRAVKTFFQRYELSYDQPPGLLIHQCGSRDFDDKKVVALDLDFVAGSVAGLHTDPEQLIELLDFAHNVVEDAFINSLQPEFLDRLQRGDA